MNNISKSVKSLGIRRGDIIITAILLLLAAIMAIAVSSLAPASQYAVITANGTEIARLPLDTDCIYHIGKTNTIEISDGQVRMTEADCPDKLCIHTGKISESGQTIVCLPNRVVISISGENSTVDAHTH